MIKMRMRLKGSRDDALPGVPRDGNRRMSQNGTRLSGDGTLRGRHDSGSVEDLIEPELDAIHNLIQRGTACSLLRLGVERMSNEIETLGLIAGNRDLPLVLAEQARRQGVRRLVA